MRIAAAIRIALHPVHVTVSAAGEEAMEPRGGLWDGVGPGDAERVESLRSRRGRERRLYGAAVLDQKSRLA
jgi:hypothetical protein